MAAPSSENKHTHHHEHGEHCSCGHEHGHKHVETCSCGHEHHGHHHEHAETCSCGHLHEHGHEHGESCACGHNHGHHHEHGEHCCCGHEHGHGHHEHAHRHAHHHADPSAKTAVYTVENLGCAHCAAKMEQRIAELPGVNAATLTFATKQLRVTARDPDALLPRIREICTSIESQVRVVSPAAPEANEAHHDGDRADLIQILIGAALFVIGLLMNRAGTAEYFVLPVFIIGYLLLGGRILLEAGRNILKGHVFDENFLMCLATLGAFAIREYPEAMGVMLFYRIGEYFEHRAVEKSRSQIMDAVDMRPEVVSLMDGDGVREIPAGEAQVGDLLLIRPGDRIPLDGVIVEGSSRLDTSPITGEPVPVAVTVGDEAVSGCVNTSGRLVLRVEKPLSESMVTRILNAVENAAAGKPRIDRFITRFARVYTPCVVGVALAVAVIPPLFTGEWNYWIYTALTFLVMSCPCALVLSVPLAFFSGVGAGSRRGILFKGGAAIEALARLGAVVMDKTGTLTKGHFALQKVVSADGFTGDALLSLCASCEQNSTHPIAHSIVSAASERGLAMQAPLSMKEIAGHGIEAVLESGTVLCGNRRLMEMHGIEIPHHVSSAGGAEVFAAVNGRFAGMLLIADTVKPDAADAVSRLKAMGLHTAMLTGDSAESAEAVADKVGIDEVHARLLPHEKLKQLTKIRDRRGAVMFVGDGINDAPVLAGADVGAAMGSGADAAIEAADAVFMVSSAEAIPEAVSIARRTNAIAVQNVVFALAIKLLVMVLGLCGFANMWMAVFADTGVAMLCVLNSIRALYKK